MERNPGTPAESGSNDVEHSTSSDKDSTKKKRRRVGSAAAASTASETSTPPTQPAETAQSKTPSPLELALAQLATETRRQKAAEAAETEHAQSEHDDETDEALADAAAQGELENEAAAETEVTTEESSETYEPLTDYGIGATEFSGGEVVIDLGGDSVEEHVISLDGEPSPDTGVTASHDTHSAEPTHATVSEIIEPVATTEVGASSSIPEEVLAARPDMLEPLPVDLNETIYPQPATAPEAVQTTTQPAAHETPARMPQAETAYLQQQVSSEQGGAYTAPNPAMASYNRSAAQPEQPITKADFDDAIYRATKNGQNRGVAAGLIAGAGYEHFKHKRREKRATKKHQETTKKLAEARKTLAFTTEQQTKQRAEYTAQTYETSQKLAANERRVTELERQRQVPTVAEHAAAVPVANVPKVRSEQMPQPVAEAEVLPVAPEHRLQTSSWHSIEVDAHTGRAVEKPVFEYGHEYYREQAQENALGLPPAQDNTEKKTPAATHDASNTAVPFGGSSLPPMYSAPQQQAALAPRPTRPQPKPAQPQPTNIPPATKTLAKPTQPAAPIWPLVLALLVVVVCLSLVLR